MRKDSGYLSIVLGVGILAAVFLGMGGIAYSFYRTEIAEEKEESLDMANDDSPFEQLKREKNIVITPVPEDKGGSGVRDLETEGIPTGTYSNPPTTVTTTSDNLHSTESNSLDSASPGDRFNSESLSESLIDNQPDYQSSSSESNFDSGSNNSLIEPLESSDFLDVPENDSDSPIETPALTESPF